MFDKQVYRVLSVIVVVAMLAGSFGTVVEKTAIVSDADTLLLNNLPDDLTNAIIEEFKTGERWLGDSVEKSIPDGEFSTNSLSGSGSELLGGVPANWTFRDPHNVPLVHDMGITGDDVTVAIADSGIDFGIHNLKDKYVVVENASSPYYGWPVAFDPTAMSAYLGSAEVVSGSGGYVNTTMNGTGPFDLSHDIVVDGKNDFSDVERLPQGVANVKAKTRFVNEFDLDMLYATRDYTNWYFGLKTQYASANRTFGFAIDMDGSASGGTTDPYGNYLDFEPSHTAPVEQVSYDPISGMVATCSGKQDKYDPYIRTGSSEICLVKIWDSNGKLLKILDSEITVVSAVVWSPNGQYLAYQTQYDTVVLSTNDWTEKYRVKHLEVIYTLSADKYERGALAFSPDNAFLAVGSYAGQGVENRLMILDMTDGNRLFVNIGDTAQSLAYNSDGTKLAIGQRGWVRVLATHNYSIIKDFEIDKGWNPDIPTIAWNPTDTQIAFGKSGTGMFEVWDYENATAPWTGIKYGAFAGHAPTSSIYSLLWTAGGIISGGSDGKIIFWNNDFTILNKRDSRYNSPVYSLSRNLGGDVFVGTRDCTVRKYPTNWVNYVPFSAKKPDVIIYVEYEREYYQTTTTGSIISKEDKISKPLVYKWNTTTGAWVETDLAKIDGEYMYKGSSAGAWTEFGLIELAIPRNYIGWNSSNNLNVSAWVCNGDSISQPADSLPQDCNLPSNIRWVNWSATNMVGISTWGAVEIGKVTVNLTNIPHQSTYVHYGTHPSKVLTKMFGPVALIVVDSTTEGVFDTVYIDMDVNYLINGTDTCVNKANPVATLDRWKLDDNVAGQDGIPDLSAGMLYFIGDGNTSLPYAYRMAELIKMPISVDVPMPIPGNGAFVAFYGDFDYDEIEMDFITQGTRMASVIAGAGANVGNSGKILGVSPDVKFLPICNAHLDLANALYFAAEGYDGKPQTGDEANIVVTGQYESGYNSGLDELTHLMEFLTTKYTNNTITFVAPAGEDGSGYGTVASPSGANLIVVGAAEDSAFNDGSTNNVHHYGQVAEWSSRGPTAAGLIKPDVIGTGWGEVDLPLGVSGSVSSSIGGGVQSYTPWGSSSLAAAVAAGTLALMFEAYNDTNGNYPDSKLAMDILTSSATDIGLDPFTQGSGFIDAYAAILTSKGQDGFIASASKKAFGDTFGSKYTSFVNGLKSGETSNLTVTFTNAGTSTEKIDYSLEYMIPVSAIDNKTKYNFRINAGKDVAGNNLAASGIKNPWNFTTGDIIAPTIINAAPANLAKGVPMDSEIMITFSNAMVPSTVKYTVTPSLNNVIITWNPTNTMMTIKHEDFLQNTEHAVTITAAKDTKGNNLIASMVPNPWTFTSADLVQPNIVKVLPIESNSMDYFAPLNQNITVTFNEPMDTSSVSILVKPEPPGLASVPTWNAQKTEATFTHGGFTAGMLYTARVVNGQDPSKNKISNLPYNWYFTASSFYAPTITNTLPGDGATDVSTAAGVYVIAFNQIMYTLEGTNKSFKTNLPNATGNGSWNGNTELWIKYTALNESTTYFIDFTDMKQLNPASKYLINDMYKEFTTQDITPPKIVKTEPADAAINMPLNQDIIITFSEPMDNSTVAFTCNPSPGSWTENWNANHTVMTVSYRSKFSFELSSSGDKYSTDISKLIPPTAQMVKVTAQTSYAWTESFVDAAGDIIVEDLNFIDKGGMYILSLWDWIDINRDGVEDSDDDYGFLVEANQRNVNSLICTLSNPHKLEGNLRVQLEPETGNPLSGRTWIITVESFKVADWPWLSLNKSTDTLGAKAASSIKVTAQVPANAAPGTYGGSIVGQYDKTYNAFMKQINPSIMEYTFDDNTCDDTITSDPQYWDDGSQGNYWSGYVSVDEDEDGIWDTPYSIPDKYSRDRYPLNVSLDISVPNPPTAPAPLPPASVPTVPLPPPAAQARTPNAPIAINGDADFAAQALANAWPGDGTSGNPYIIENYEIDPEGALVDGIRIENTNVHFVIRNCKIYNTTENSGIYLLSVSNGNIEENDFTLCEGYPIYLTDCAYVSILSNSIINNTYFFNMFGDPDGLIGIYIDSTVGLSNELYIANNTISNSSDGQGYGIGIYMDAENSIIEYNTISDDWRGITFGESYNNIIRYNTFSRFNKYGPGGFNCIPGPDGDHYGVIVIPGASSSNNLFYGNAFVNNTYNAYDINTDNYWNDTSFGNYWEGYADVDSNGDGCWDTPYILEGGAQDNYPLMANPNQSPVRGPITINSDADFTPANGVSAGDGSDSSPFIIENWIIDAAGAAHAIYIGNTTLYYVVRNCLLTNATNGIHVFNSMCGMIYDCDITDNENGTWVNNSMYSYMEIRQNHITRNTNNGLLISASTDIVIEMNNISGNGDGILIEDSDDSNIEIRQNHITRNTNNGLLISTSTYVYIEENSIFGSGNDGASIANSDNIEIVQNHNISDNTNCGIRIFDSADINIEVNGISGNANGVSITDSDGIGIMENHITHNDNNGVSLVSSEFVEINGNILDSNTIVGVILDGTNDNTVSNNNITNNGIGVRNINAVDFNDFYSNNFIGNTQHAFDNYGNLLTEFDTWQNPNKNVGWYLFSCNVTVDGVLLLFGTDYTFNKTTGLITFNKLIYSGSVVVIQTVFYNPDQIVNDDFGLPHSRIINGTVEMYQLRVSGTFEQLIEGTHFWFFPSTGLIRFAPGLPLYLGIFAYANYTYYNRTNIIPLALNVLISTSVDWEIGNLTSDELPGVMPVTGLRSGYGSTLESGDRRYFHFYVPNQGRFFNVGDFYLYLEATWNMNTTDFNIVLLSRGPTQSLSPEIAPYSMNKVGGSEEKADFEFFTTSGGPKEILMLPFNNEILTICISLKSASGIGDPIQLFEARSGWIQPSEKSPKAWTNSLVGHSGVSFMSSIDLNTGISASIVGPAQGTTTVEDVYFDDPSNIEWTAEGWLTYLANGKFTKVVTVENALSWDVSTKGHANTVDLDLAIFLDGAKGQPKDGLAQWQEIITLDMMTFDCYGDNYGGGRQAYSADADADEAVKFISPPDGDYIIKVLGFTLLSIPAQFDLNLKTILAGVEGYKLGSTMETEYPDEDGTSSGYMNYTTVPKFEPRTFNIVWSFLEDQPDGTYGGIFVFGIPDAQKLLVFSVDIILDREAPTLIPGFTGPGSIVYNNMPTISAKIEDLAKGEIDPSGAHVEFDGKDITNIATISIGITDNSADQEGYWTGDIIYKPMSPLSEGGHYISIDVKDKTGNSRAISWGFTVDTTKPILMLSDGNDKIFTRFDTYQFNGSTEPNSIISVIGVNSLVTYREDNSFTIDVELKEGSNDMAIKSTDPAGNIYETLRTIILDTEAPLFKRVVALDGSTTNKRMTGIYGEMTETGTLELNGMQVPVNSDGTFRYDGIMLVEGQNTQTLKFTDWAGNVGYSFMNITLDSIAPMLLLADIDKTADSEWLNITGKTEGSAASLTINGKLVDVDASGNFQNNIRLSPGINTIVIETKDRAGNSAQEVMTVVYAAEAGTNYAAIGLMVVLLIVGLILGLFLAPIILGKKKEEMPEDAEVPDEEAKDAEIPAEGEEIEAISEEVVPETESTEPIEAPTAEVTPESEELAVTPESEELAATPESIDEDIPETEEMEPIPTEESIPEEIPSEPAAEDPRVAKLKEAYDSGKISKELYEKNLARFKGE